MCTAAYPKAPCTLLHFSPQAQGGAGSEDIMSIQTDLQSACLSAAAKIWLIVSGRLVSNSPFGDMNS